MLIESGFILQEVVDCCHVQPSLTNAGDLEIELSARDEAADAEFCNLQSIALAEGLNSQSSSPDEPSPELLQFVGAASSAPLVEDSEMRVTPGPEPGPGHGTSAALKLTCLSLPLLLGSLLVLFVN